MRRVRYFLVSGVAVALLASCTSTPGSEVEPGTTEPVSVTASVDTSTTTGTVPESSDPTETILAPITGYGDFSDVRYRDVDWVFATELMIRCARDQGVPVKLTPDGEGIDFMGVPPDQNAMAGAIVDACRAGLNIPDPVPVTREDVEKLYDHLVAMVPCLESFGLVIPEPPSKETFLDTYPTCTNCIIYDDWWDPYARVYVGPGGLTKQVYDELLAACPRTPPDW